MKNNDQPTSIHQLLESLKRSHLRVTEPRLAILNALIEKHGPFTVDQIYQRVTQKVCDLATVYRCLSSLEKNGIIRRCEFGDGSTRYELSTHKKHHHHHVICRNCKKIEVLENCKLQELDQFAKKKGFTEVTHLLEFFGLCNECH